MMCRHIGGWAMMLCRRVPRADTFDVAWPGGYWSDDGNRYALNAATGIEKWSYAVPGAPGNDVFASPAVANGVVYFESLNNHVPSRRSAASPPRRVAHRLGAAARIDQLVADYRPAEPLVRLRSATVSARRLSRTCCRSSRSDSWIVRRPDPTGCPVVRAILCGDRRPQGWSREQERAVHAPAQSHAGA